MYSSALWLHSLLRWAILFTGLVAWFRAIGGNTAKRPWTPKDDLWGLLLTIPAARFFTVEHAAGMLVAIALIHVGRVKIRKASEPARKHRLAMIFFGIAIIVTIIAIPWPGMPVSRPLLRP